MRYSKIVGLGHHVPETIITNQQLTTMMDTTDEWIIERTGIKERRWIDPAKDTVANMAAKDGSMSFDFEGTYTNVQPHKTIEYAMPDGRKVTVAFSGKGNETKVVETFDAESENPIEMQRGGWQAILDNFKKYTESL